MSYRLFCYHHAKNEFMAGDLVQGCMYWREQSTYKIPFLNIDHHLLSISHSFLIEVPLPLLQSFSLLCPSYSLWWPASPERYIAVKLNCTRYRIYVNEALPQVYFMG